MLLLLRFVETNPITRGSPSAKLDNDSWHFAQTKVPLNSTAIDAITLNVSSRLAFSVSLVLPKEKKLVVLDCLQIGLLTKVRYVLF